MRLSKEQILHRNVASYIQWKYKDVIFNSDLSGDNKNRMVASFNKNLRSSKGFPDMVIYEGRGGYSGLFIELKAEGCSPFKKDGKLKAGNHLREQAEMIEKLKSKDYWAQFCTGFDEAKACIDWYMKLERS